MQEEVTGFSSDCTKIWPSVPSGLLGDLPTERSHQLLAGLLPRHWTPCTRPHSPSGEGWRGSGCTAQPSLIAQPSCSGSITLGTSIPGGRLKPAFTAPFAAACPGSAHSAAVPATASLPLLALPCASRDLVCQSSNATVAPILAGWDTTPSPGMVFALSCEHQEQGWGQRDPQAEGQSVLAWHDALARKQETHNMGKTDFILIQSKQLMMLYKLSLKKDWSPRHFGCLLFFPHTTSPQGFCLDKGLNPHFQQTLSHLRFGKSSGDSSPTNW